MSSSDLAISVRGLSKSYTIRHQEEHHITLAELLLHRARHPLTRQQRETFWALADASFDVRKGEVLGVIGRNGAGKSTLLKLLSRITPPTKGEVRLYGRVGSLLEVGTGFHPELTGRENVYLNGAILGMRTKEINRRFDEIVEFAGVDKFLDTPVKRFSSGMYVRLAFAVAAHLDTEILLVDEVLAVGDADFQRRCLGKMGAVAATGRTVLFVSHQMASISTLCTRALVLNRGGVEIDGGVDTAVRAYTASFRSAPAMPLRRSGSGELRVVNTFVADEPVQAGDPKYIRFTIERVHDFAVPYYVSANIVDERERVVAQCDSRLVGLWLDPASSQTAVLHIRQPWLLPGDYRVDIMVCCWGLIDLLEGAAHFTVAPEIPYPGGAVEEALESSMVLPDFDYVIQPAIAEPAVRHEVASGGSDT